MNNTSNENKSSNKILWVIIVALSLIVIWLLVDGNSKRETINNDKVTIDFQQAAISSKDSLRLVLQGQLDQDTKELARLTLDNKKLNGKMSERARELFKARERIKELLANNKISSEELLKAQAEIAQMTNNINDLAAEVAKLKLENQQLTVENDTLKKDLALTQQEKAELADIASTLNASEIIVEGVHTRRDGKEKQTSVARRVDGLKVSFVLDDNRLSPTGKKSLYVCVYSPDGNLVGSSGNFKVRDGSDKQYTSTVDVDYTEGQESRVSILSKGKDFTAGSYKVDIYNNGFLIGSDTKELRKSWW